MAKICKLPQFPHITTHYKWIAGFPEYQEMIRAAREDQADTHADRIIEIAYETLAGVHKPEAARVAIDALKWIAAKMKPKVYGERVEHNIIRGINADELSDADLARIAKAGALPRLTTTYSKRDDRPPEDISEAFEGPDGIDWKLNALERAAEYEETQAAIEAAKVHPGIDNAGDIIVNRAGDNQDCAYTGDYDDDWLRD